MTLKLLTKDSDELESKMRISNNKDLINCFKFSYYHLSKQITMKVLAFLLSLTSLIKVLFNIQ